MDNDGIGNKYSGRTRNEDKGGFGNEDSDREMLNKYLLEQTRLEDAGGEDDDEVRVDAGSGDIGSGVDKAFSVYDATVMGEAVGMPMIPDELFNVTIVLPAGVHADDDVPELSIRGSLLSGSDLSNAPVAESTPTPYNCDNADLMMYLWD
jgi:hypothetical protein